MGVYQQIGCARSIDDRAGTRMQLIYGSRETEDANHDKFGNHLRYFELQHCSGRHAMTSSIPWSRFILTSAFLSVAVLATGRDNTSLPAVRGQATVSGGQ